MIASSHAREVAVATLANGEFVTVWTDGSADAYGDIRGRRIARIGTTALEPAELLTSSSPPFGPLTAELAPSVAPIGGGHYLVLYQRFASERGLGIALSAGASPPLELAQLDALISDETGGGGSVATSPRGVWAVWSTGADPEAQDAYRAVRAFLLAID